MINFAPFYKDIDQRGITHKKLKKRIGKVDYRKNLKILYESFKLFNPNNNFIIQTDNTTELPYTCNRSDLSEFNLMESLIVANLDYVKNHVGKSILVGVDNVVLNSVDTLFDEEFDLGFYCLGEKNDDEKFNLSNGVVLVNSNNSTHDQIVNFFNERHKIYQGYDKKYKSWWGDMLSLNHLVSRKNIIEEFYASGKQKKIYDFDGLKIKIFEVNKDYYKWVDSTGSYKKDDSDVILDFPGDNSVKQHAEIILNKLKEETTSRS